MCSIRCYRVQDTYRDWWMTDSATALASVLVERSRSVISIIVIMFMQCLKRQDWRISILLHHGTECPSCNIHTACHLWPLISYNVLIPYVFNANLNYKKTAYFSDFMVPWSNVVCHVGIWKTSVGTDLHFLLNSRIPSTRQTEILHVLWVGILF